VALEIEMLPVGDNYIYFLREPESGVTACIDPAVAAPVLELLQSRGLGLDWILATHHHVDHVAGIPELKEKTGCRVLGPAGERVPIAGVDQGLAEGERVTLGSTEALVIETPGHTAGHISYFFAADRALFCADALFSLGCGRLFEGSPETMWTSLSKLRELPDDTRVYCGHEYTLSNARFALTVDPDNRALRTMAARVERQRARDEPTIPSRLGDEKQANPFLRPDDPAIRAGLGMETATDAEVFGEIRRRKDRS
jgi:hydroxyacylglutathione hydrolase